MRNKYFLFGASGHAKVVIDIMQSNHIQLEGILDDLPKTDSHLGIKILNSSFYQKNERDLFLISIGSNEIRKKIVEKNSFDFFSVYHSSAFISNNSSIGIGTVIMPNVIINSGANIGNHCIINSGAIVEHDCVLSNFVHISPNASLAGGVAIGEGTQIGIGANIIQNIKIGKWAMIGAGSTVIKDVPDYAVVVGNPAKIIKYHHPK